MGNFKASNTNVTVMNADDLEVDAGTLSVDASNNRVGIGLTAPKTELTVEGSITLKEAANASSDTAAYGQLWVKSDAPCNLYFTDDTGQDVAITANGSLAGVAGSLSGLGSTDNVLLRTNGTGGETAQGSGIAVDDSNNVSGMGTLGCGAITSSGRIVSDDATEATSTTDGSLQTDGGLSVAKSAVIGDDLDLLSDGAIVNFGASKEIVLTHVADTGLTLSSTAASTPVFEIKNTHNGGTAGILKFNNTENGQDGADDDDLGSVTFWGNDDGTPSAQQYAGILAEIHDATSGEESGKLTLQVASHDGGVESGLVLTGGSVDAEVDVTIGLGSASVVTVPGDIDLAGSIDVDGTANLDNTDIDGTLVVDGSNISLDSTSTLNIDCSNTSNGVTIATATSGVPVSIGHTTSETTVNDNLTVTGDTTMTGDLTLNGGDLAYGNGQNATLSVTSTAHNAAGKALTISAGAPTAGTTNNIAGGSVTISAGQGKGTGAGGDIVFKTANAAGGAASSLNALATALTISDDLSSTFAGAIQANSNVTFGVDDTGVDVRFFSATASEGVLYDASEDELALLLTTKLKFHDVGGGEEIFASSNGHLEINSGTTLDMTAPTVDINASTAVTVDTPGVTITDSTTSSATEGGFIRLVSDDGAAMANDHRLGVIEFAGAEDASSTITVGAKIEAICDAGWSATENGTALVMSTTDANASQSEVLRLDSDKLATFAGASLFNGNATFGVDDTGVDVRLFSATASEGVLYDASEDELALLLTTKLKFHDVGGGEEIYASADGHLEVNAGTTLDMTAPTIDINASTAVTVDSDLVTFGSANANDPLVIIKNTTDDTASARLRFVKDRGAAGEDNDNIGTIEFYGDDDAQDNIEFASIGAQVADASNGAEGGRLVFRVATHDGEMQSGITIQDGDAEDEVDVTIGNGAASLTTIAGEMKVTEDFFQGDARRVIYEEVDVRHVNAGDDTVSIEFGNKIPQDSVVTRVVALVKTASNLGTHNVQIRFDGASGRAADTDIGTGGTNSSAEALGAGATNTRSSTNVGSAVDIDLTAAKESYINDTPQFMTSADVYPYVCNAGTSNGGTDSSAGTLLVYIEYYGID